MASEANCLRKKAGNGDAGLAAGSASLFSVIWFFGFRVFFWNRFVEDAVAPYAQDLQICSAIEQYSDDFWQANARNSED